MSKHTQDYQKCWFSNQLSQPYAAWSEICFPYFQSLFSSVSFTAAQSSSHPATFIKQTTPGSFNQVLSLVPVGMRSTFKIPDRAPSQMSPNKTFSQGS